jgi:hypothetical protein
MPTSEPKREIRDAAKQADDMFKLIEMCEEIRKMPPHDHQEVGFREDCMGCKARENHQMPTGDREIITKIVDNDKLERDKRIQAEREREKDFD